MKIRCLFLTYLLVFFVVPFSSNGAPVPKGIYIGGAAPENGDLSAHSVNYVGDPISIYYGKNYQTQVDLKLPTPHYRGLVFKRSYNSRTDQIGPLGYGWSHSFDIALNPSYIFNRRVYLKVMQNGYGYYFEEARRGHYEGAFKERTTLAVEDGGYVWYRLDGSRFVFDSRHLLTLIEDGIGNRQYFTYDKKRRLQSITDDATNYVLEFQYNTDGLLSCISGQGDAELPDAVCVVYKYDQHDNLISVTYPDGSGFNYVYDDPNDVNNLTEKRDKAGKFLSSWTYDDQDRAITNVTHDDKGVTIQYVNEQEVRVTDAHGVTRVYGIYSFEGHKRVLWISAAPGHQLSGDEIKGLSYDRQCRLIEVRYVSGSVRQYFDYGSWGKAKTIKYLQGTEVQKIVRYTYHPKINAKLSKTELSANGEIRNVVVWDYDEDENDIPNENPMVKVKRRFERGLREDESGKTVPYEQVMTFEYDKYGCLVSMDGYDTSESETLILSYDGFSVNVFSGELSTDI
jgi:YD repeat-containing protein